MTVRDRLFEHRRRHGCGHALELALTIIEEQAETITRLTAQQPTPTVTATVTIQGERNPTTMAIDKHVGDPLTATVTYQNADGTPYTGTIPDGTTVAFTDSDTAVASVDPASGTGTVIGAGDDSIGATVTFPDGTSLTAAADTVHATVPLPAAATVTLA